MDGPKRSVLADGTLMTDTFWVNVTDIKPCGIKDVVITFGGHDHYANDTVEFAAPLEELEGLFHDALAAIADYRKQQLEGGEK